MAVTINDIVQPGGHVDPKMFPGLDASDFDETIEAYISEGDTRAGTLNVDAADVDPYTRAWAHYRSFMRIAERLYATPASAEIDGEAQRQYNIKQAEAFERKAREWLAKAEELLPPEESTPQERGSGSIMNRPVW